MTDTNTEMREKVARLELTKASEVLGLMASDDAVIGILKNNGVAEHVQINVAYALIAQRKDAFFSRQPADTGEGEHG